MKGIDVSFHNEQIDWLTVKVGLICGGYNSYVVKYIYMPVKKLM